MCEIVALTVYCKLVSFYQRGSIASHASAAIAIVEMSVRRYVRLYCMTTGEPEVSCFCKYQVYPEIRKGSPRARALNGIALVASCLLLVIS